MSKEGKINRLVAFFESKLKESFVTREIKHKWFAQFLVESQDKLIDDEEKGESEKSLGENEIFRLDEDEGFADYK